MSRVHKSISVDKNSIDVDELQQYQKIADIFIYFSGFSTGTLETNSPFCRIHVALSDRSSLFHSEWQSIV
ncbi:hypothetical protein L0657_12595 [Dyadobacter sp. CY345]|uniref:hypothetical protein n=1 Tax=Dyadobacter sp. CY345 TaxID=2909335 RepID=UPI001F1D7596|nr:hypothetical protein [Dyadobacter sp. CY345]MCF2444799.1 hypothetical protein [Dyadobacter sp. CY345]